MGPQSNEYQKRHPPESTETVTGGGDVIISEGGLEVGETGGSRMQNIVGRGGPQPSIC